MLDALKVFRQDMPAVLAFSAFMLWGAIVILAVLERGLGHPLDGAEMFSLLVGGWIVPVLLFSVLEYAVETFLPAPNGYRPAILLLILGAGFAVPSAWAARRAAGRLLNSTFLAMGGIFLALVCLRLAFVARLPLPLYFDSVQHYRIIQALAGQYSGVPSATALRSVVSGYYHLGFHLVLATVAWISQAPLGDLMLVSGQIVLAAVPLSLFIIPYRETGSALAGLLAVAFGALGWYMPAHALSWGKYPAVFGIGPMLFALNTAYLATHADFPGPRVRRLLGLAALGAVMAAFVHTRAIVVLAMALLAWIGSARWYTRPASERRLLLALAILTLVGEVVLVLFDTALSPGLDPYLGSGIWVTALIGLLAIPALHKFRRLACGALLMAAFLLAGLFIRSPDPAFGTLLDRPLVEMVLFIPLAVLGGAGFAGLTQYFRPHPDPINWGAAALLSMVVAVHAFNTYGFYPSACCSLVSKGDMSALDWIAGHLPQNARVLIASEAVTIFPAPFLPQYVYSDAGAWILPLTHRAVSELAYWSDFREPGTLAEICQRGATDVYAGAGHHSFRAQWLQERPAWYRPNLNLPGRSVYHVSGCADP